MPTEHSKHLKSVTLGIIGTEGDAVFWLDDMRESGASIDKFEQLHSDKNAMTLKEKGLIAYTVHAVILNSFFLRCCSFLMSNGNSAFGFPSKGFWKVRSA